MNKTVNRDCSESRPPARHHQQNWTSRFFKIEASRMATSTKLKMVIFQKRGRARGNINNKYFVRRLIPVSAPSVAVITIDVLWPACTMTTRIPKVANERPLPTGWERSRTTNLSRDRSRCKSEILDFSKKLPPAGQHQQNRKWWFFKIDAARKATSTEREIVIL